MEVTNTERGEDEWNATETRGRGEARTGQPVKWKTTFPGERQS